MTIFLSAPSGDPPGTLLWLAAYTATRPRLCQSGLLDVDATGNIYPLILHSVDHRHHLELRPGKHHPQQDIDQKDYSHKLLGAGFLLD